GEEQAHIHAAAVEAHGHIQGIAQLAELRDLFFLFFDPIGRIALKKTAKEDVVPAVGVRLDADADVQQAVDLALHRYLTCGWRVDAREQAQQRALAGAVMPDEADPLALAHLEVDVLERINFHIGVYRRPEPAVDQQLLQRAAAALADMKP